MANEIRKRPVTKIKNRMLLPRAGAVWPMTQEPWESLDRSQAAVLALCTPGKGRRGAGLPGVLPGKSWEGGEGWRNRFPVSQGTTAVTTEGRRGGELGPSLHKSSGS